MLKYYVIWQSAFGIYITDFFPKLTAYTYTYRDISYNQSFLLPGIKVKVGDKIEKGGTLVVLSAMKMEVAVQAPKGGTVKSIAVTEGQKIDGDDLICTIE